MFVAAHHPHRDQQLPGAGMLNMNRWIAGQELLDNLLRRLTSSRFVPLHRDVRQLVRDDWNVMVVLMPRTGLSAVRIDATRASNSRYPAV